MGIVSEYLWFWLASLTCFACYGYIVVKWWMEAGDDHELIREAVVMAWYPIGASLPSYLCLLRVFCPCSSLVN